MISISNSTGNFSLLCSEYMKIKISDLVMFAEVDLVSMYPDSASAHDKKEWNNSVTRKCSNTRATSILVLKTNWRIEIYWTCLNHPINNPLRNDSQNLPSDCLQQFHTNEDFRFSDALQHDKNEWNNSVVALKCSKTSATSILHLRFPFPILPSWLLKHWELWLIFVWPLTASYIRQVYLKGGILFPLYKAFLATISYFLSYHIFQILSLNPS